MNNCEQLIYNFARMTLKSFPFTNSKLPTTNSQLPITHYLFPIFKILEILFQRLLRERRGGHANRYAHLGNNLRQISFGS